MKRGLRDMLLRPWFLIALSLALAHQLLQKRWLVQIEIIDSFLDPLLFMPLMLHLMLLERRFAFGKGPAYILPWSHILLVIGLVSVVCEVLFPRWSNAFTADCMDAICYAFGGLVFGIYLNAPLHRSNPVKQDA